MPAKKSPWFNARRDPPVNGGNAAMYEHRCRSKAHVGVDIPWKDPHKVSVAWIDWWSCDRCQWRGLLRESDDA